jgi:ubiquinone biosynthesis protein
MSMLDDIELPRGTRFIARLVLGKGYTPNGEIGADDARAPRLRKALEDLGPVFVKLGQALSTRPDLIPNDIAVELAKLQDEVPPFDSEQAMAIVREAYGEQIDKIFANIDPLPLASASVAQVHAATLQPGLAIAGQSHFVSDSTSGSVSQDKNSASGHESASNPRSSSENSNVVIKIIRPGAEKTVRDDLQVMHFMAAMLQKYWSRGRQFRPKDVVQEYENTILGELDLRVEAANGTRMGANFEDQDIIYVPRIYWDYTQRNVLVMERIYGISMRNIEQVREAGIDLKQLAADGVSVFFKQAFEDNFFHADMHSGNIFVSEQGKWIAIDFGIMGTLNNADKHYLAEILLGFFNRDYARITRAHFRSGWIPAHTNAEEFELAVRLVCEPIFAKPLSEISFGKVLMELFQTVRRFEMPVQPQLVLLYKTLLNIEGLGRQLYPDLNLWDTAKPFLEKWMKQQLSPKALIDDFVQQWPYIRQELLSKADQINTTKTFQFSSEFEHLNTSNLSNNADQRRGSSFRSSQKGWLILGVSGVMLWLGQTVLLTDVDRGLFTKPMVFLASPLELIATAAVLISLWAMSRRR